MDDISKVKITDMYTGLQVRESTPDGLRDWLKKSYTTVTAETTRMIDLLHQKMTEAKEINLLLEESKWYAESCGLKLDARKTRRKY